MNITLRPYQRQSLDALYQWFLSNPTGNPLLVLPTGAGKAILIAALIQEALAQWPETRILMLTHVRELISQNAEKLISVWPDAPIGIHSAGLRKKDCMEPILFAGIQSIWKKAFDLGARHLVLIDEVHLVSHKSQGMYRSFLNDLQRVNPHMRVIGLTATPFRTGHGSICEGEDAIFHDVAHQVGMLELIEQGYLSKLVTKRTDTQIDVSDVKIRQGEYMASQLQKAVDRDDITQAALDECQRLGADRKKWLVFCAGVEHAEHVASAMNARGIKTGCITGKTPTAERDMLIQMYRQGQLRALTSMGVLTTGFDVPDVDLLILLRPTQSPGLFVQMVGRASRIAPGKQDALILDFAGNTMRHGPVDQIEAWTPRASERGDAPSKTCPDCETIVATAVRECPECGYLFPFDDKPKHEARASNAPILSSDTKPIIERFDVANVTYQAWQGRNSPTLTLRVDYQGNLMRIASEWVCFEHTGYARDKAVAWWATRAPGTSIPKTVNEALSRKHELRKPTAIDVDTRLKYPEIKGYVWNDERDDEQTDERSNESSGDERVTGRAYSSKEGRGYQHFAASA